MEKQQRMKSRSVMILMNLLIIGIISFMSLSDVLANPTNTSGGGIDSTNEEFQVDIANFDTNVTNKIVGGTWAKRGAYPFQAVIALEKRYGCAGTLLESKRHVLTAAHCIATQQTENVRYTVYFRSTVLEPLDENHIERQVIKLVQHEEFNNKTIENDLAILTLNEPVNDVQPVRLEAYNASSQTYDGQEATIIGWGYTKQVLHLENAQGPVSNHLQQANVTIVGNLDCNILYQGEFNITNNRICVSTLFGKGVCQGDSGGPLLIDGVQVGVVSAASGCADPRFPALFIRIGPYREWIERQISDNDQISPTAV